MASIQKISKGYRAQIKKQGVRESKTFTSKRDAVAWATERELQITSPDISNPAHTLRHALRRYSEEVSVSKRGRKWEQTRLAAFEKYLLPLDLMLSAVQPKHIANFRDDRLSNVMPGSVIREMAILSSVFSIAIREWGWANKNPCKMVSRPTTPKHRERTLKWCEIRAMLYSLDFQVPVKNKTHAVAVCFLTAIATGMRAGELCNLTWDRVYDRYVYLDKTKNGNARNVPLSRRAKRYIEYMRGFNDDLVFGLDAGVLSTLFRRHRKKAGLSGFTFHDARHTAATLLAKKVDVLTLCKIMGWSNPKMAMVYYNPDPSSIADLLG